MTTPTGLELVWAYAGGVTDPGNSKYQTGWVAEIPSFQNFNHVLKALDLAKLAFAEQDIYAWQDKINYHAGARVERGDKTFYCITTHNDFDGTNPQDPELDTTNSYWVSGTVFSGTLAAFANLRAADGVKVDHVNTRSNNHEWTGNDITLRNISNIISMTNSDAGYDNLLFGNVRGKMVIVNVGKTQTIPDGRSLLPSANSDSFELFHEGHHPDVTEVTNALDKNPVDGKLYGRRNGNWVEVTTTTVNEEPPQASVGAGATWYNLQDGRLYVDIYDGNTSQWVPASPPIVPELKAAGVDYDNTASGLSANNLQASTDELAARQLVSNPNYQVNGDFAVWARGSSFTEAGYTADRIFVGSNNTTVRTPNSNPLSSSKYVIGVTATTGDAGITGSVELVGGGGAAAPFLLGEDVTISFWAKSGAPTTELKIFAVFENNVALGGDSVILVASDTVLGNSTASWSKQSFTFNLGSQPHANNKVLRYTIYHGDTGVGLEIGDLKIERGSLATRFEADAAEVGLSKCLRHYEVGFGAHMQFPWDSGANIVRLNVPYKVSKPYHTGTVVASKQAGESDIYVNIQSRAGFTSSGTGAAATTCTFNWTAEHEL